MMRGARSRSAAGQRLAGLILLSWSVACGPRDAQTPISASQRSPALEALQIGGCDWVDGGKRCILSASRRLLVWSDVAVELHAAASGMPLAWLDRRVVGTGVMYELTVPAQATAIELSTADTAASAAPALYTSARRIELRSRQESGALVRARALRAGGDFEAAAQELDANSGTLHGEDRARAASLRARLTLDMGRTAEAAAQLQARLIEARQAGRVSDAISDGAALSFLLIERLADYPQARAVLDSLVEIAHVDPVGRARLSYYEGLLSQATGELALAVMQFDAAAYQLGRWQLREHERNAREQSAVTQALLGRYAAAIAAQRAVVEDLDDATACSRADRFETLYWLLFLSEPERDSPQIALSEHAAREAEGALQRCAAPRKQRNHLVNVGLFAVQQGDFARAVASLRELTATPEGQDTSLAIWQAELGGRIALARHDTLAARTAFARALALSRAAGRPENAYFAALGLGRTERAVGHLELALAWFDRADEQLDDLLRGVPPTVGAASLLSQYEAAARAAFELLVDMRRPELALDRVRRARARLVTASSQGLRIERMEPALRARWQDAIARYRQRRAAEEAQAGELWKLANTQLERHASRLRAEREAGRRALIEAWALLQHASSMPQQPSLRPLTPGELLLSYVPGESGDWAFCMDAAGTDAVKLPRAEIHDRSALAQRLLEPFSRRIDQASQLRLIAAGALSRIDYHALSWRGQPLGASVPVAYGTDSASGAAHATYGQRVLAVVDPTQELAAAAREAELISHWAAGRELTLLRAGEATRARVLSELERSAVLHFAGHAVASDSGQLHMLQLADGTLDVADVLSAGAVPELVVLGACEAARSQDAGLTAGLGLAQAFSARGSRAVIAPTRLVRDSAVAELMGELYAALSGAEGDAVRALSLAQQRVRGRVQETDWAAFRVFVP